MSTPAPLHIVVLAAGKGTRMKSASPKVLHEAAGLSLLRHVLRTADALSPASTTVIVGHEHAQVTAHLADLPHVTTVIQEPQLGTGHALLQAESVLTGRLGTLVLLSGDVPLLTPATLSALVATHDAAGAAATVMTAMIERPTGYGRIVRAEGGDITRIVEERDASPAEREIKEVNAGIYAFDLAPLFEALRSIGSANAQNEYYLPDLIAIYRQQRRTVATWTIPNAAEVRGVNSRSELAEVARLLYRRNADDLMAAGVTLINPVATSIDVGVTVGADSVLYPGVMLQGRTVIGRDCTILPGSRLLNATLGDGVTVLDHCLITDTHVGDGAQVGPFAHLRPGSRLGRKAKVGNFVELKKASLGDGAKVNHLSYVGDATIGDKANIGAGTITCNYDGVHKHQTVVGAGAFVGSNSTLVAPVTIGDNAYVAAGSTVTAPVPDDALAVGRARQQNKDGWAARRRARQQASSHD
jgi:bifunctional UDP-N-acetylglucosamine pyrophosphorylase/glucosamine-1-phosphate N-acetyltransferase